MERFDFPAAIQSNVCMAQWRLLETCRFNLGIREWILWFDNRSVTKKIAQPLGVVKEAFTDADNFSLTFPIDLDVKVKATLLGAVFLIDFMFFEKKNNESNDAPGMMGWCCQQVKCHPKDIFSYIECTFRKPAFLELDERRGRLLIAFKVVRKIQRVNIQECYNVAKTTVHFLCTDFF